MKLDKQALSARIRGIMEKQGLTQSEFADLLGISQPAVSQYLQGRVPPVDVLLPLARLENTSIEWLLTGEKNTTRNSLAVKETPAAYGDTHAVLEIWPKLPRQIRRSLLVLMRNIEGSLEG